jgi:hypothetical protein
VRNLRVIGRVELERLDVTAGQQLLVTGSTSSAGSL